MANWILQQYGSMALQRPLSPQDLVALEIRARAGSNGPALEPALWEDFKDWFSKCVRVLKQVDVLQLLQKHILQLQVLHDWIREGRCWSTTLHM